MPIAGVSIPVSDQQVAKAFYVDVLGFAIDRETDMPNGTTWIQLQPPGGGPFVTLTSTSTMTHGSVLGLVFDVPELDALIAKIRSLGHAVDDPAEQVWGRYTTIRDPDGNGWVLATRKPH